MMPEVEIDGKELTGLVFPPIIAKGEESAKGFRQHFARVEQGGLDLEQLRGITSDGAQGLASYMKRGLSWVQHQRCVWHLWRNFKEPIAEAAKLKRKEMRKELIVQISFCKIEYRENG